METFKQGESTAPLGNLCQCSVTSTVKMQEQNLIETVHKDFSVDMDGRGKSLEGVDATECLEIQAMAEASFSCLSLLENEHAVSSARHPPKGC